MGEPHIEVMSAYSPNGAMDVANQVNVDSGPLALPAHIRIGKKTWDGDKILNYTMQVDEYAVWLEDTIKEGTNMKVLMALDDIYNKAIRSGVILTTICMPIPNITHAHKVQQAIMELAAQAVEPEG